MKRFIAILLTACSLGLGGGALAEEKAATPAVSAPAAVAAVAAAGACCLCRWPGQRSR